ncbi:MAG: hypothetical protein V2I47_08915 [Bacteroidales bacterium]|jgi:hypothetical protein|nr:hypothetical protein [Bacteroidales bacterium]
MSGNETLKYFCSNGAEVTFEGNGRNVWVTTTDYGGECYESENDDCIFWDLQGDYRFIIRIRPITFHTDAHLSVEISDYTYSENWHYSSLVIFTLPLDKNNLADDQTYYDSLKVNGNMFYDVYAGTPKITTIPTIKSIEMDTVLPSILYYNSSSALLKVDFNDGSTWELKEILN